MAEQPMSHDRLMNAVDLVAVMAVSDIARKTNESPTQVLLSFMASRTAAMLYDTQTEFWCDGPAAVAAAYMEEILP